MLTDRERMEGVMPGICPLLDCSLAHSQINPSLVNL